MDDTRVREPNIKSDEIFIFRWKTFLTKHVNKEWSSSFDEDGYGPMFEDDYKRLLESHGFMVTVAKPYPLSYKITRVKPDQSLIQDIL